MLRRAGAPLRPTGSAVVVEPWARVALGDKVLEVEAFAPGRAVHAVALAEEQRRAILAAVARGLRSLHDAGVGHGAVDGSSVRIGADGAVRLVGARRGAPEADADALDTLARELWDEIPDDVATRLEEGLEAWCAAPAAFLAPIDPEEPPVQPHALTGQTFSFDGAASAPASERPPKVQVALVAGLTLILGLLAGAFLAGCSGQQDGPPVEVTLHVPGAIQIAAYCGGEKTYRTQGANVDTLTFQPDLGDTTTCEVEAPLSPVMPLRGQLTLSRTSWTYRCDREGVVLVCSNVEEGS